MMQASTQIRKLSSPFPASDLKWNSNISRHGEVHNPMAYRRTTFGILVANEPEIPEAQQLHKQHFDAGAAEKAARAGMGASSPGQVVTCDCDILVFVLVARLLAELAEPKSIECVCWSHAWKVGIALMPACRSVDGVYWDPDPRTSW